MQSRFSTVLAFTLICACSAPAAAQWIKQPTSGVPRTADGKLDVSAPAPRTPDGKPDLSGMWRLEPEGNLKSLVQGAGVQPWARERQKKYDFELGRDDPNVHCLPQGPRAALSFGFAAKILQTPGLIAILFEDLSYRQIFMDGRDLPSDPNPTWMGYSVGRWDGDTLVVTSQGFTDRSLLDFDGHPHSEALRVTERYRRTNFGHMDVQVTLEDPKTLDKPVTLPMHADFVADTELLEYVCQENERSRQRLVGTLDDDRKLAVAVPANILARYAGSYLIEMPEGPKRVMKVMVKGQDVTMDVEGIATFAAVPVSNTKFLAQGIAIEFFPKPDGTVTDLVVSIVEGDLKGVRVP